MHNPLWMAGYPWLELFFIVPSLFQPLKFHCIYFEGSQIKVFGIPLDFCPLKIYLYEQTVQTLISCHIMRHLIFGLYSVS